MSDLKEPCNVGNPREMTILEFAETIRAAVGSSSPIVFKPLPVDDPQTRQPDITQARERLGWEPKVSLQEGLESTIGYFRQVLEEQGRLPRTHRETLAEARGVGGEV